MTGGLDSSSIAAIARHHYDARGTSDAVHAHTIVYDRLIPDRERHFAGLVARHIRVPIAFFAADEYRLYAGLDDASLHGPEPSDDPFRAMVTAFYRGIADRDRVLLMGLDGDTFLCEIASDYLIARLRRGELGEYLRGVASWMQTRRSLPPHRVRSTLRRVLGASREHRADTRAGLDGPGHGAALRRGRPAGGARGGNQPAARRMAAAPAGVGCVVSAMAVDVRRARSRASGRAAGGPIPVCRHRTGGLPDEHTGRAMVRRQIHRAHRDARSACRRRCWPGPRRRSPVTGSARA